MEKYKDTVILIKKSEEVYNKCFYTLMDLKKGKINMDDFLSFQPDLAEILYEIMNSYQGLCQEEKDLVSKKDSSTREHFLSQIRDVGKEKVALKNLIKIGKSLGDGFAWFFYRNSREELDKHLTHKSTGLMTSGIGGRGEIEFIKRNQNIDGLFVIYHGITSMLRIGDFSLCTGDGSIIGIGELKSKQKNKRLCISAYISAKADIKFSDVYNDGEAVNPNPSRLEKQLDIQDDLLRAKKSKLNMERYSSKYNVDIIQEAIESGKNFALSKDKSLMVITELIDISLAELLLVHKDSFTLPNDITEVAKTMLIDDSEYNEFRFMLIEPEMYGFRQPIVWWRINDEDIKNLIFGKLQVCSIFNIAHWYEKLLKCGYSLKKTSKDGEKSEYKITKKAKYGTFDLVTGNMLIDLVLHDFIVYSEIINTIEECIDEIEKDGITENTKIEFRFQQRFF